MLTEENSHPGDRFLSAVTFVSNDRIRFMLNHIRCNPAVEESSVACDIYEKWHPQRNEIMVYTTYAYADLEIPKAFNCIFKHDDPDQHVISRFQITQVIYDLGGHWPLRRLTHGHKHFSVLTFDQDVPELFGQLKELGKGWDNSFNGLGLCDYANLDSIRQNIRKK